MVAHMSNIISLVGQRWKQHVLVMTRIPNLSDRSPFTQHAPYPHNRRGIRSWQGHIRTCKVSCRHLGT